MSTSSILLVDDDPALLHALTQTITLRMSNVQVETALSAEVALALLRQREYDTLVSDIKMPGIDGLALLSLIKEQFPEIPVLLIAGYGQHDLAVQALRGGAYDYTLLHMVTHELATPLTSLKGLTQLIERHMQQGNGMEQIVEVFEEVKRPLQQLEVLM